MARKPQKPKKECTAELVQRTVHYFFLAGTATIVFLIMSTDLFNEPFYAYVKGPFNLMVLKGLIFFGIMYILDRYIENWRYQNVICR